MHLFGMKHNEFHPFGHRKCGNVSEFAEVFKNIFESWKFWNHFYERTNWNDIFWLKSLEKLVGFLWNEFISAHASESWINLLILFHLSAICLRSLLRFIIKPLDIIRRRHHFDIFGFHFGRINSWDSFPEHKVRIPCSGHMRGKPDVGRKKRE